MVKIPLQIQTAVQNFIVKNVKIEDAKTKKKDAKN